MQILLEWVQSTMVFIPCKPEVLRVLLDMLVVMVHAVCNQGELQV